MVKVDSFFNFHFYFVFTPKDSLKYPNKRFLVSANQLHKYIGIDNANKALYRVEFTLLQKTVIKFRKCGKLEIYAK